VAGGPRNQLHAALHVSLNNEKTVVGTVQCPGVCRSHHQVAIRCCVTNPSLRHQATQRAEQVAYDKSLRPGLVQGWQVGSNVGSRLRGNRQTKNLALPFTVDRKTLHDPLGPFTNSL
jgi:hypothetical protein